MFKFQSQVLYEQLSLFAKEVFVLSGKLPAYESNGLIKQLRGLASGILEDYAESSVRTSKTGNYITEKCVTNIAKISSLIDLCHHLGYIDKFVHDKWLWSCNDTVKRLYDSEKHK